MDNFIDFYLFYHVIKKLMITRNSVTKIQNLVGNHESQPIMHIIHNNVSKVNRGMVIRVSQMGSTGGDNLDKMAKNYMKSTKLAFFGQNSWGYMGGTSQFFG